ncbi:Retrovirus-related Pol polyprotein from transposon 17.6 [Mytilus coruscus]|uniref:Retrovirus-related Pol polyprotein from transposon 17.6 n=1 Tax=Mytilus coruscus TaxID=42192 RepID=A0A6J8CF05_MYTCO|nr:Retrovirus-related Pol polyprotein from transposon 17.6 [Mytilus coruscus]
MLDNNIIEPSQSEWASPVCLVRKKGSTSSSSASNQPQYRFCIDFRRLNLLCVKRVYPIVQMDDIVDMLGEAKAKFYSTVDMFNGYHQIKLDPETKHKTAFTCHEGVFEFNRLPFGLSNSPHTFQLVMSEALRGINWKSALVYMDDVLLFSKNFRRTFTSLTILFQKLREVNLKLKPTKCTFAAKRS